MQITRHGLQEDFYGKRQKRVHRGILRSLGRGSIFAFPIDSSKKKKTLHTGVCDMCGITILQGKHCKPCSDKKRNTYTSYSKSIFE